MHPQQQQQKGHVGYNGTTPVTGDPRKGPLSSDVPTNANDLTIGSWWIFVAGFKKMGGFIMID